MRSWQGPFEMDGRLQLEQSGAASRAVPAEQTEQARRAVAESRRRHARPCRRRDSMSANA